MKEFLILFKHEMKMQFPLKRQKGKRDFLGALLSLLTTLIVVVAFVVLVATVVKNYVRVEIHRVPAPMDRGLEMLNFFYLVILLVMTVACMEKMRSTLTQKRDRELFLRLPVRPQALFMSKLCTLLVWTYIFAFVLIFSVNAIFAIVLKLSFSFWIRAIIVWLFMPTTAFLIATVLLVPYIKTIDFISEKYWLIFLLLSIAVIIAFILYSGLLSILQSLLETGSIKFLFNERFITTLQSLLKWGYPANCFARIAFNMGLIQSLLIAVVLAVVAIGAVYFISKTLFYATLYKNQSARKSGAHHERYVQRNPLLSLMKKEFICVFREPKHLFSYLSIATAMPVMVYCCYTLFDSLIKNAIGLRVDFSLSLLVLLIFSILTNTFCATNVTRDGLTALKSKMFPVKASTLLLAKVLFCAIVSCSAVLASAISLVVAGVGIADAVLSGFIALLFSLAQIFIATRMDLNNAKVSASPAEVENASNRTIAKVVFLGLILALLLGVVSMCISIFANTTQVDFIAKLNLKEWYAYLLPVIGSLVYLGFGVLYYVSKLEKSFDRLIA